MEDVINEMKYMLKHNIQFSLNKATSLHQTLTGIIPQFIHYNIKPVRKLRQWPFFPKTRINSKSLTVLLFF